MKKESPSKEVSEVKQKLKNLDLTIEEFHNSHRIVFGIIEEKAGLESDEFKKLSPWIEEVRPVEHSFKRASRQFRYEEPSQIEIQTPNGVVAFGENNPLGIIADACAIEDQKMILKTAESVKESGAKLLRGSAFKSRTSPYSFQEYDEKALDLLVKVRESTGLGILTEVRDTADVEKVAEVADIVEIGARNMQNFSLLKEVGIQDKPILLKRGISATIEEWLMAAEYILGTGNHKVILCERGIRTFDSKYTRNTLDLTVVPVLREISHLPIVVDPSYGTGQAEYVTPMAMATVAVGADGLMVQVHPNPSNALSDGKQSLTIKQFYELMRKVCDINFTIET